tara:strand:+ start:1378 stop:5073 length:3696 start_codon:yes stop_codon:yes gene_type:complete
MAGLFNDLIPKEKKIPDNIQVNQSMFSDLLPSEDKHQFKITDKGNPGSNLSINDAVEPGLFDDLVPQVNKVAPENKNKYDTLLKTLSMASPISGLAEKTEDLVEDIDGDSEQWQKVAYASQLGFFDTYRGIKQITGFDEEKMKADQEKLYEFMKNPDGSTNWGVAGAYFGSAILDPAGWLLPVTKAKTLYNMAKWGFVSGGIIGGVGYVDEDSLLDTRGKQAAFSALGGTFISPVIGGIGKKLKGEKVFTRESLGIPGFDAPSIKVQADIELQKIRLQNAAGKKHRTAVARKKIEVDEPETIKDLPSDKAKLLRGPRLWMRENVVKAWEKKVGKPALNYLTNGNYGAETAGAIAGGTIGYATAPEEASIMTKFGLAFTGALMSAGGIKATKHINLPTRKFGKGEAKTEEVSETLAQFLGRNFIDGYRLPRDFKKHRAEAQGFANHIALKFVYLSKKIKASLTDDEQKILHNLLQGDTKIKVAPAKLQELSKESRKLITEVAQEYVDAGLLTVKTFENNKDIYLKRSYRGKLEDRPFGEELKLRGATDEVTHDEYLKIYKKQKAYTTTSDVRIHKTKGLFTEVAGTKKLVKGHKGWELLESSKANLKTITDKFNKKIKATRGKNKKAELVAAKKQALKDERVEIRWQYTKPQRVGLSEIEDAAFAIAETGRAFASTLSQYRFYKNISRQNYTYDTWGKIPMAERTSLKYRQMPTTEIADTAGRKRYGALAGKFVPEEIYKNLVAANRYMQHESGVFYKNYRWLNSYWKVSKTAWNPTVHVNNIMSNFVLHDLVDAQFKYLPKAWKALTTHGKASKTTGKIQRSELVDAATKHGVFDAGFVQTELKNIQAGIKFPYKFDESIDAFNNSVNAAKNIFQDGVVKNKLGLSKLTDWYQFEDMVFRLSVFQDRISKGWSLSDAALDARKSFVDYNIDAPAINWMRNSVTPFLAYTYRIIPILGETALVRPWKYAKYAALGYGLNKMGDLVGGGDEEAERAVMPERKQGRFLGLPFLPYRNIKIPILPGEDKKPYYMDFTRFVPGGDVLDLEGTVPGVPAPLQWSGGLAGEVLFSLAGFDLWRGERLKGQTGDWDEDIPVRLKAIKDKLIPNIPFLSGSYSSKKLERERKGLESPFRAEQAEGFALLQTLGFKIEKADIKKLKTGKVFELKRKIDGFKEQINLVRKKFKEGVVNRETARKEIDIIADKIRKIAAEYGVAFKLADRAKEEPGLFDRKKK